MLSPAGCRDGSTDGDGASGRVEENKYEHNYRRINFFVDVDHKEDFLKS